MRRLSFAVVFVLIATVLVTPGAPSAKAADAVSVVASGAIQTGPSQADTFDVTAIADGAGGATGSVRLTRSGTTASGTITCLRVDGSTIVVGGEDTHFSGGNGPTTVWFTMYLTDNGPNGMTDTAAFDGPTNNGQPDCSTTGPSQQNVWYGQVTIITGSSDSGTVSGSGTNDLGGGYTRTFSFDAYRDADGAPSGTFSISESQGFVLSGTIDCLDIRGEQAMLVGHGPHSGGGSPYFYTTIFIADGGPAGAGDLMSVNAYRQDAPFGCLAAQEYPFDALTSGDVDVSAGATPTPTPPPTPPPTPTPPPPTSATPSHPVIAAVTSPLAGTVTISESPTTDLPPVGSGYTFLGHQLDISAPAGSSAAPLAIVLTVDAALLASVDPDLTAATVTVFRNGIAVPPCTASPTDDPATPDPCVELRETLTGGDDAGDARITVLTSAASHWNTGVSPAATLPGAPSAATASKGDRQATVTWTAPASDGQSLISGYTVTSSPGDKTASVDGTTTAAVVTGLTNGTAYTFTVTATNAVGTGPASAPSNPVVPAVPLPQTITFAKPTTQSMTASPLIVTATASSGLPVSLASTTAAVCTVAGFEISFVSAGTCSITATQAGNGSYKPATPVVRAFTINQATQTITFARPANQTLPSPLMTVSPTASSGLTVSLASTTSAVCTVAGFDITVLAAGTCTITATQPGNATYKAAPAVTRAFTVSQATQTITFAKPANQTLLASPLAVSATATSGLTVTLTSTSPSVCTVSGFVITLLTPGSCSITASQSGNEVYKPASAVSRSFTVTKAPQTITIPDPGPQSMQQPTVVLHPTASSGLSVSLTTQTASVCTVAGTTVTLKMVGTCKIKGDQVGNAIYAAAPSVIRQFSIGP